MEDLTVALDADNPTGQPTRSRPLWCDVRLDAVACEGSRLIRRKGGAVDGGCAFKSSRTRVYIIYLIYIYTSKYLTLYNTSKYEVLRIRYILSRSIYYIRSTRYMINKYFRWFTARVLADAALTAILLHFDHRAACYGLLYGMLSVDYAQYPDDKLCQQQSVAGIKVHNLLTRFCIQLL